MPDRKPTVREKALAKVFVVGLEFAFLGWISWSPWYVRQTGIIGSGRTATAIEAVAILGSCVCCFVTVVLGIWVFGRVLDWLSWALETPADAEPDHFEAIDERRI